VVAVVECLGSGLQVRGRAAHGGRACTTVEQQTGRVAQEAQQEERARRASKEERSSRRQGDVRVDSLEAGLPTAHFRWPDLRFCKGGRGDFFTRACGMGRLVRLLVSDRTPAGTDKLHPARERAGKRSRYFSLVARSARGFYVVSHYRIFLVLYQNVAGDCDTSA
jgi:hypothetical protein